MRARSAHGRVLPGAPHNEMAAIGVELTAPELFPSDGHVPKADITPAGEVALRQQLGKRSVVEKFNRWFTLVGNLGVIAGIIFLAYEIQANTNAVRSATYQAFNDSSFSWADSEIENAAVLMKINESSSLDELTPEQRHILNGILFKAFTVMESNYLHHRAGSMDDDVFEAKMAGSVGAILSNPLWSESFKTTPILLPEFREFIEARIKAAQSTGS